MRDKPFKIALIGPESTGKTVLAKELAAAFNTHFISEYAAEYIAHKGKALCLDDLDIILKEQLAREDQGLNKANHFLFCDSDALTTKLWSQFLFQQTSDFVESQTLLSAGRYKHTLLLAPDTNWHDDAHRYTEDQKQRDAFFQNFEAGLTALKRDFTIIRGYDWKKRKQEACKIIRNLI